jgi:hypothetical protein
VMSLTRCQSPAGRGKTDTAKRRRRRRQ